MSEDLWASDVKGTLRAAKLTLGLQCILAIVALSVLVASPNTPTDPTWLGRHRLVVIPVGVLLTVVFGLLVVGISRRNRTAWLAALTVEAFSLGTDFGRVIYGGELIISSSTAITVVALWALLKPSMVEIFLGSGQRRLHSRAFSPTSQGDRRNPVR